MKTYLICTILIVAFFSFNEVNALKPQKIEICHFDSETNTYKLLNVSQNGWENGHKKHGDGLPGEGNLDDQCNVINPVKVFARVYREKGNNEEYDPATDDLYVEVVDYNEGSPDGVLNIGDKIRVIALPADENGDTSPVGVSEHIITGIPVNTPTTLLLETNNGIFVFGGPGSGSEFYAETGSEDFDYETSTVLIDEDGGGSITEFIDTMHIRTASPSRPASDVNQGPNASTEDPWLEVRIYN